MLKFYPKLIEHLNTIPHIKKVLQAKELSDLDTKTVLPIDGALYVVLDNITPKTESNNAKNQKYDVGISLILIKQSYNPMPHLDGVGETLTAIAKAMNGFDPTDNGKHLTASPFMASGTSRVVYAKNFALYPLYYTVSVVI